MTFVFIRSFNLNIEINFVILFSVNTFYGKSLANIKCFKNS